MFPFLEPMIALPNFGENRVSSVSATALIRLWLFLSASVAPASRSRSFLALPWYRIGSGCARGSSNTAVPRATTTVRLARAAQARGTPALPSADPAIELLVKKVPAEKDVNDPIREFGLKLRRVERFATKPAPL